MANISVPSIAPGAKSLPSELKIRNPRNMVQRMKAQHPGVAGINGLGAFPYHTIIQSGGKYYRLGMGGLRGLGQESDDGSDDGDGGDSIVDSSGTVATVESGGGSVITIPTTTITPTVDLPDIAPMDTVDWVNFEASMGSAGTTGLTPAQLSSLGVGAPTGYTGPTVVSASATPPAAPTGYQWASVVNSAGQTLAKVMAVSQGGTSVTLPNGTQLLYGSPAAAEAAGGISSSLSSLGTTLTSNMPLVLIVIGALIFLPMLTGGSKR